MRLALAVPFLITIALAVGAEDADPQALSALGGMLLPLRIVAHREADLGGQHDVLPLPAGERFADDLLDSPAE